MKIDRRVFSRLYRAIQNLRSGDLELIIDNIAYFFIGYFVHI